MTKRPFARYGSVSLIVFAAIQLLWLVFPGFFTTWEMQVDDQLTRLAYQWQGRRPVSPDIVHIDLDDRSAASIPFARNDPRLYGEVIRILRAAGVRTMLVDIIFPSCNDKEGCTYLAEQVKDAGNVYFPLILSTNKAAAPDKDWPVPGDAAWNLQGARSLSPPTGRLVMGNYPALSDAAAGLGHINCDPDRDGIYRRVPLLIRTDAGDVPSLALQALRGFLRVKPERISVEGGHRFLLREGFHPDGRPGEAAIPVDRQGRSRLSFAGPWKDSFNHYSFETILELGSSPQGLMRLADELEDVLAIISDTSTGGRDFGPVPLSSYFPLSGLYSNLINSALENDFLTEAGPLWNLVFATLFLLILTTAASFSKGLRLGGVAVALFIIMAAISLVMFIRFRLDLEIIQPTIMFALALPAILLVQFLQVQQEKARLTNYFAPSVVRKLLDQPALLDAVEKRDLTVLFSDIVGFTAWSSTREAEDIHRTLNTYFEEMAAIVFAHEGTIDKYMGDGLLVFFGDPVPYPDHARRAVQAALAMQEAVRRLREEWEQQGGMPIQVRIGIHTGEVVVGNMGSRTRLDYTVIGSNVNLAQRLESNCPPGGVLISEEVQRQLGGDVQTQPAGIIQVKGFSEPVTVHTVQPG